MLAFISSLKNLNWKMGKFPCTESFPSFLSISGLGRMWLIHVGSEVWERGPWTRDAKTVSRAQKWKWVWLCCLFWFGRTNYLSFSDKQWLKGWFILALGLREQSITAGKACWPEWIRQMGRSLDGSENRCSRKLGLGCESPLTWDLLSPARFHFHGP